MSNHLNQTETLFLTTQNIDSPTNQTSYSPTNITESEILKTKISALSSEDKSDILTTISTTIVQKTPQKINDETIVVDSEGSTSGSEGSVLN
jgi:hypothetical protein